jgi:hypothetical protein
MKTLLFFLLAILALGLPQRVQAQSQEITGFGSSEPNPFNTSTATYTTWSASELYVSTATLTASNVSDSSGGFYEPLPTPVSILGDTAYLTLTGSLTSPPPPGLAVGSFQLTLYDNSGSDYSLTYDMNFNDFLNGTQTVSFALSSESGAFDGTVSAYELAVGGSPAEPQQLSFVFNSLTASAMPLPEPSTDGLFGAGAFFLAWLAWRQGLIRRFF